jgi:hypothetical protein
VLIFWFLACSVASDFCDRQAAWQDRCTEAGASKERRVCEQSLRACDDHDFGVLDAYSDCLDAGGCTSEAFFDCADGLAELHDPTCGFGD